jgi:hypothetical protein
MAGCGPCEAKRRADAERRQAKGKSTGKWSVTLTSSGIQGKRYFFDNKLAAMAFLVENDGEGYIRAVT